MVLHLFRVVASLDSMVLGEAQILGQVKDAYELLHGHGDHQRIFNKLFRQSFEVGKRVRTETEIGESAVSSATRPSSSPRRSSTRSRARPILSWARGR